jgi:hypothetical protein
VLAAIKLSHAEHNLQPSVYTTQYVLFRTLASLHSTAVFQYSTTLIVESPVVSICTTCCSIKNSVFLFSAGPFLCSVWSSHNINRVVFIIETVYLLFGGCVWLLSVAAIWSTPAETNCVFTVRWLCVAPECRRNLAHSGWIKPLIQHPRPSSATAALYAQSNTLMLPRPLLSRALTFDRPCLPHAPQLPNLVVNSL